MLVTPYYSLWTRKVFDTIIWAQRMIISKLSLGNFRFFQAGRHVLTISCFQKSRTKMRGGVWHIHVVFEHMLRMFPIRAPFVVWIAILEKRKSPDIRDTFTESLKWPRVLGEDVETSKGECSEIYTRELSAAPCALDQSFWTFGRKQHRGDVRVFISRFRT
jgi:hypothetical protein